LKERYKVLGDEVEDVRSYGMAVREREDDGYWRRKH